MLFQILLAFIKFLDYKKTLAQEAGVKSTPDQTYFGTFRKDEAAEANNSKSESESVPDQKYFWTFGKDEAAEAKNSSNKHEGRHKNHRLSNVHLEND